MPGVINLVWDKLVPGLQSSAALPADPANQARLKSTLDALDGAPVKTLIDTHWHFDHTDNNASFRSAGAAIVAHGR